MWGQKSSRHYSVEVIFLYQGHSSLPKISPASTLLEIFFIQACSTQGYKLYWHNQHRVIYGLRTLLKLMPYVSLTRTVPPPIPSLSTNPFSPFPFISSTQVKPCVSHHTTTLSVLSPSTKTSPHITSRSSGPVRWPFSSGVALWAMPHSNVVLYDHPSAKGGVQSQPLTHGAYAVSRVAFLFIRILVKL